MNSNESLVARRQGAVARGVSMAHPVFIERAENALLWDADGRRYVDFAGGIAVLNTGHRHPRVLEAVRAQLERVTHTCFQVTGYEPYVALCERLNRLAPGPGPNKTLLMTTGAEAIENAVKIARASSGRSAVISFAGGFHGRTLMALALTGKVEPYKAGFGPYPAEVYHAPFPNALHDVSTADALDAIAAIFKCDVAPERVAVLADFEGDHRAEPAHFGDIGVAGRKLVEKTADLPAEAVGPLEDALLLEHVQHGERRRAGDRIAGVGAAESAWRAGVHDVCAAEDRR